MSVDVEGVNNSSSVHNVSQEETQPAAESSESQQVAPATDDGRTSKIGEQSFNASMVKSNVLAAAPGAAPARVDPGGPPQSADAPLTFSADDKVPRFVYPGHGNFGPNATPKETADFIRSLEMGISGDVQKSQAQFFTQALENHKNQPEWTQQFFRALGSEKTAQLIENSLTPGVYQYSSQKDFEKSVGTIRDAISGLASNPQLFSQADMDKLVGQMAKGSFNPWVASELFGKMSYQNEGVKNMFFDAAVKTALDPKTSARTANDIAASASHVLATTSTDNQTARLNELREDKQLTSFIQKAMAGPQEMPGLWSVTQSSQRWTPVTQERFARVDGLLLNASVADIRDGWQGGLPISSADLSATRTQMFNAAAQALTDGRIEENFKDNSMFKDAMSSIFMKEFDPIMNSGLGSNGAGFDILKFQPGLEKFFQHTLFTPNPSSTSKALSNFLANKMTEIGQGLMDTSPGAEQKFFDKFGRTRMDGAAISGGLLGMLTNSIKASKDDLKKDAEAKAASIKLLLDITLGFVPGIGGKLAQGVENTIAKTLIEKTLGPIQSSIIDKIKSGAVDEAKKLIMDQYKNKDPETAVLGLFNALNQTIPNGDRAGEPNFLTQFQSSYSTVINSPYRITR